MPSTSVDDSAATVDEFRAGATLAVLASRLGVSHETVRQRLIATLGETEYRAVIAARPTKRRRLFTDTERAAARALYEQGATRAQVAAAVGCDPADAAEAAGVDVWVPASGGYEPWTSNGFATLARLADNDVAPTPAVYDAGRAADDPSVVTLMVRHGRWCDVAAAAGLDCPDLSQHDRRYKSIDAATAAADVARFCAERPPPWRTRDYTVWAKTNAATSLSVVRRRLGGTWRTALLTAAEHPTPPTGTDQS